MNVWITLFAMGAVTFGTRASVIMLLGQGELPPTVRRALRYVPPAVLTAIIFPELFMPEGVLDISPTNFRLIAGIVAALIAWRTKNTLAAIGAGMLLLWALGWLFLR